MTLEEQFHSVMEEAYSSTGKETGYWANYFLRSVRKNGGLATAKRMLVKKSKNSPKQDGLTKLIKFRRADLSVEFLVLNEKFRSLFTSKELEEAQRRLDLIPSYAFRNSVPTKDVIPGEYVDDTEYTEGSKKRVVVNAFERNSKAREACLKKFGYSCQVCGMSFSDRYGEIGGKFIHVHHKKLLACRQKAYKVDPVKDLIPVCPNCHAMLHTSDPPLRVDELKSKISDLK